MICQIALLSFFILCGASAPLAAPQHRSNYAQGIRILNQYYREQELVSDSQFDVISKTCSLLSIYERMQESPLESSNLVTPLLQTTLIHGCYNVREMLGEAAVSTPSTPVATSAITTASATTSATTTEEEPTDSCSQLQYLHSACRAAPQYLNKLAFKSVNDIMQGYLNLSYNRCAWGRANNLPQFVIDLLFRDCTI